MSDIDFVIPWVDGNDPVWQSEKAKYKGVGGLSGLESGDVASPVAGSKLIMWGYSGIAVFNPYRSFVAREI